MEEFLNIDWHPPLDDLIDNVFINEERMKEDSVMYKIMQGRFTDPFTEYETDDSEKGEDEEEEYEKDEIQPIVYRVNYVPGIVKSSFHFPRVSNLNKEQQATCLRVLLRFSGSEKPEMNATTRSELALYMKLSPTIRDEQEEFLEMAKSNWDGTQLNIMGEKYINERWKSKVANLRKLPRYYVAAGNIPFNGEEKISVTAKATLLELGKIPRAQIPAFLNKKRFTIIRSMDKLQFLYPPNNSSSCYNKTVSQDPNCERLTESGEIDLVISSGGLNCLANNFGPNYTRSWILPIVVKENKKGNVIYIDKPLPPTALTAMQKNSWIYKYFLLSYLLNPRHHTSIKLSAPDEEAIAESDIFGDPNSNDLLELEKEQDELHSFTKKRKTDDSKPFEDSTPSHIQSTTTDAKKSDLPNGSELEENCQELSSNTLDEDESPSKMENSSESRNSNDEEDEIDEEISSNVVYKSFTLGPSANASDDFTKTKLEQYRILVRTRIHGIERIDKATRNPVMLIPKLEHQVALGAEAVTAEEALKQWTMLTYRPNTSLVRIRISAESSEVIQVERRTAISINNEIKRLYNLNAEDSLTTLHNVVCNLKPLKPGNYLLRHTPTNGAFATLYQEADISGKNVFDLHAVYAQNSFQTIPTSPWPALDKAVITPAHICFERMPAMYHPARTDGDGSSNVSRGRGRGKPRGLLRGGGRGAQNSGRGARGGKKVRTKKAKKKNKKKTTEEIQS